MEMSFPKLFTKVPDPQQEQEQQEQEQQASKSFLRPRLHTYSQSKIKGFGFTIAAFVYDSMGSIIIVIMKNCTGC